MFGIQKLFDKQIEQQFQPHILGVRILDRELEKIGLKITDKQRLDLETQFKSLNNNSLTFDFNDEQLIEAKITSEEELKPKLKSIVDNLGNAIEQFSKKIDGTMEDLVLDIVEKMAESVKSVLAQRMNDMLEDQDAIYYGVAEGIQEVWGKPLGLLQGLIVIADEAVEGYLTKCGECLIEDITLEVLFRLHARANQISKEILTLLKNGFADGAQARWRSLHELVVVCSFISQHGSDVAQRYLQHESVESYKAAIQYNQYYVRLGASEIPKEEIELLKKDYDSLISKYGDSYKFSYGWAAQVLNNKNPNFSDIEKSVELDHQRPFYKAASANVHANPSGVLFRLGLFPEEDVLLAGSSSIGLADPAKLTVISLVQMTTSVLTYNSDIDFLVVCKSMYKYSEDVESAFIAVEKEMNAQRDF